MFEQIIKNITVAIVADIARYDITRMRITSAGTRAFFLEPARLDERTTGGIEDFIDGSEDDVVFDAKEALDTLNDDYRLDLMSQRDYAGSMREMTEQIANEMKALLFDAMLLEKKFCVEFSPLYEIVVTSGGAASVPTGIAGNDAYVEGNIDFAAGSVRRDVNTAFQAAYVLNKVDKFISQNARALDTRAREQIAFAV